MENYERNLNGLIVFIISLVILGAFGLQIFVKETPCPLCYLQRIGMLGVASGALLNLRYGGNPTHYALSLLSAFFGGFVALRQVALHVCPNFSKFGKPFWGISLYTWSFFIFAASVIAIALLMLIFRSVNKPIKKALPLNTWGYLVFVLIFIVALGNVFATFMQCGFGPCADVP